MSNSRQDDDAVSEASSHASITSLSQVRGAEGSVTRSSASVRPTKSSGGGVDGVFHERVNYPLYCVQLLDMEVREDADEGKEAAKGNSSEAGSSSLRHRGKGKKKEANKGKEEKEKEENENTEEESESEASEVRSLVLVGGGGGEGKTGVTNGLLGYVLSDRTGFTHASSHEEGEDVVHNMAKHPSQPYVACGVGKQCVVLRVGASGSVEEVSRVQTDESEEGLQKAVAFCSKGDMVAVGMEDTRVKVLSFPALKEQQVLEGHSDHVTAVGFLQGDAYVVSASKDGTLRVWDRKKGECVCVHDSMTKTVSSRRGKQSQVRLSFRAFAIHHNNGGEGGEDDDEWLVYTLQTGKNAASYVEALRWSKETEGKLEVVQSAVKVHALPLTCMDVDARGTLLAMGDVKGTLVVCETASLWVRMSKQVHGFFISGVQFDTLGHHVISVGGDRLLSCVPVERTNTLFGNTVCNVIVVILVLIFLVLGYMQFR